MTNTEQQFKITQFGRIPKDWNVGKINETATIVTDYVANGSFASLAENVQYKNSEDYATLIRLVDFHKDFKGDFVYIDEHAYNFLSKSKLFGGEIIIANVGENVGTVFRCPYLKTKMSLAPNSIMVKFKDDDTFYYYRLKSSFGQFMLKSIISGSAQPKFNKTSFRNMEVPIPPLPEQKAIARVLSSLDDKIELLRAENQTLEGIGQTLFREWFGKYKVGDELPDGWKVGKLGEKDFAEILGSGIKRFEGEKIYLATADVSECNITNKNIKITYESRPSRANMQPIEKSIWFAKMQDSRKLLMFDDYSRYEIQNYILSTGFAGVKTTKLSHYYVRCFILSKEFDKLKNNIANGAVQIAANNKNLEKIEFIVPNEEILNKFNDGVRPLFEKIYYNNNEIESLSKTRDQLLSKLMSGEVRVNF